MTGSRKGSCLCSKNYALASSMYSCKSWGRVSIIIDGATADQFMAKVTGYLEQNHREQIL
jgi:hypothetical protein